MNKFLTLALVSLAVTAAPVPAAVRAETADSLLENKKQRNAPPAPAPADPRGILMRPSWEMRDAMVDCPSKCLGGQQWACGKRPNRACVCRPTGRPC